MFVTVEQLQAAFTEILQVAAFVGFLGAIVAMMLGQLFDGFLEMCMRIFMSTKRGKQWAAKRQQRTDQKLQEFLVKYPHFLTRRETQLRDEFLKLSRLKAKVRNDAAADH